MNPAPFRFSPVFVPRIWGARSLAPFFDAPQAAHSPIGEVWLTGEDCVVESGSFEGKQVRECWRSLPAEWKGSSQQKTARMPLLVKFIFPVDKLSIQVHPDDAYAAEREAAAGGCGKTEMWYAMAARPGAELLLGLHADVTAAQFRRAISEGAAEACLTRVPVHAGDCFFVPAGTAHTIGPGMVLCEIQQYSDLTYRVYDYNRVQSDGRKRELHIEKALDVMRFGKQRGGRMEAVSVARGALKITYLLACPHFAAERWEFSESVAARTAPERFELLITLAGTGCIESAAGQAAYGPAQAWFVPAALGNYSLRPESSTTLLKTYVPDLEQFARELPNPGARAHIIHP